MEVSTCCGDDKTSGLYKYICKLYEFLREKAGHNPYDNKCFIAGAFVIRDDDGLLYNELKDSDGEQMHWVPIRSHDVFTKPPWSFVKDGEAWMRGRAGLDQVRDRRINSDGTPIKLNCGNDIRFWSTRAGRQYYFNAENSGMSREELEAILEQGGPKVREVSTIKFYRFTWDEKSKEQKPRYVFLKLETTLSSEFKHVVAVVKHKMGSVKKMGPPRREVCSRPNEYTEEQCLKILDDSHDNDASFFDGYNDKMEVKAWWQDVKKCGEDNEQNDCKIDAFYIPSKKAAQLFDCAFPGVWGVWRQETQRKFYQQMGGNGKKKRKKKKTKRKRKTRHKKKYKTRHKKKYKKTAKRKKKKTRRI